MKSFLTSSDKNDLIVTIVTLLKDYILENTIEMCNKHFESNMIESTYDLITLQLESFVYENNIGDIEYNDFIDNCINIALKNIYKTYVPRRSYRNTFIRKGLNIDKMDIKINKIKNTPQPEQRTNAWYEFRWNLLTASSIWKAFLSPNTRKRLIYDKCKPLDLEKYNKFNINSSLHWGHKYEPLSVMVYENQFKTTVEDFGCIQHDTLKFLGASPDGIITDRESLLYGRMLEIKNIVNREIDGIPKYEYWIQMQMQMECCNLNECDFLETKFTEYDCYDDYINDGTFSESSDGKMKGIMLLFLKDNKPHYEYHSLNITLDQFLLWEEETMNNHKNDVWVSRVYWKLEIISCVLVLRNKLWFKSAIPLLINTWKDIEKYRKDGYEHLAPKKRTKKITKQMSSGCLIDIRTINGNYEDNIIVVKKDAKNESILEEQKNTDLMEDNSIISNEMKAENNNIGKTDDIDIKIITPPLVSNSNIEDILKLEI